MRKLFFVSLTLALCCTTALAQDPQGKAGAGVTEFLQRLQKKLEQIVPRKSVPLSTVAAGVHGRESLRPKLYWKGNKEDEAVTEEELAKLKSAIEAAEHKDRTRAIKELEEFMKQYPDSTLIPDAKKTLDLVSAEGKELKK